MKTLKILCVLPIFIFVSGICSAEESDFRFWAETRGIWFSESEQLDANDIYGNIRIFPELEIANDNATAIFSLMAEAGSNFDVYEEEVVLLRSNGKKSFVLLQEAYVDFEPWSWAGLKIGRMASEFQDEVRFDFTKLSPFAQLDSSEPFRSLDDDRQLGSWGVVANSGLLDNNIALEAVVFVHEDPILATHEDDPWTRPMPFGMDYGSFESGSFLDWGLRLSQDWWEFSFFQGSANSPNHLVAGDTGKLNLVFPDQTSLQGAVRFPLWMFNLRAGAVHNWRRWQGNNAGQFLSGIVELEWLKEGVFRSSDNLLLEVGFADVWDTKESELLQKDLGIDQIYRGGSVLFTAEYSPVEDWVLKVRSIWNSNNDSFYFSPEIRKFFYSEIGEWDLFLRGTIIEGSSDDVISAYSDNDVIELGIRFNFN